MSGEVFETLLLPHLTALRKLVHGRLKRPDHVDDIVQQVVLRAFCHRDQLLCESKFKSWLFAIASNEVRMFFRQSRPYISLEDFPHRKLVDGTRSPFAHCEASERERWLHAGMAKLNHRDRTAIRLADLNGLSAGEAAHRLTVSQAAFKSTLFRARQRLGEVLGRAA